MILVSDGSCDAGDYQVVATNYAGSVTSLVAMLTVINNPTNLSPAGSSAVGLERDCGDLILDDGSTYYWRINDATGSAGTNWDLINAIGILNVAAATNPFIIKIISLTASNTFGLVADFVSISNYVWTIVAADGGITNFDTEKFALDSSAFSNVLFGSFSLAKRGNTLAMQYNTQPLSVTGGIVPGGGFLLSFEGPPGIGYRILASSSLFLPLTNWMAIPTGIFDAGLTSFVDFGPTNFPLQFYRILSP